MDFTPRRRTYVAKERPVSGVEGFTYATVPEWIVDAAVSDRAVRLFAVLTRYVGANDTAWPSRRLLADRLRCSPDSIDRAVAELVLCGAITARGRLNEATGARTSSEYWLWPKSPTLPHPRRGVAAPLPTPLAAPVRQQEVTLDLMKVSEVPNAQKSASESEPLPFEQGIGVMRSALAQSRSTDNKEDQCRQPR